MVSAGSNDLLPSLEAWLQAEPAVCSAVLFGSRARKAGAVASHDAWSDVDLHIVTDAADRIVATDWARVMVGHPFCMQVLRPATGGTKKLTVMFEHGEVDLVLVGAGQMRLASLAMRLGLHRRARLVAGPLNTFATIMSGGYRFLKGEPAWGKLYARVVAEMAGYRLNDTEVRQLADSFLCDLLWVLQKLERGELVAAQRILHKALHETNVVLLHELRVRKISRPFSRRGASSNWCRPPNSPRCRSARAWNDRNWRSRRGARVKACRF